MSNPIEELDLKDILIKQFHDLSKISDKTKKIEHLNTIFTLLNVDDSILASFNSVSIPNELIKFLENIDNCSIITDDNYTHISSKIVEPINGVHSFWNGYINIQISNGDLSIIITDNYINEVYLRKFIFKKFQDTKNDTYIKFLDSKSFLYKDNGKFNSKSIYKYHDYDTYGIELGIRNINIKNGPPTKDNLMYQEHTLTSENSPLMNRLIDSKTDLSFLPYDVEETVYYRTIDDIDKVYVLADKEYITSSLRNYYSIANIESNLYGTFSSSDEFLEARIKFYNEGKYEDVKNSETDFGTRSHILISLIDDLENKIKLYKKDK